MTRFRMTAMAGAAALVLCVANAASAGLVLGISNANDIIAVDTTARTEATVFRTGLTGNSNGVAFDDANGRLLYRNGEAGSLYVWDRLSNIQTKLTGVGLPGSSSNAAFHDDAYWYVEQNTDDLVRVALDFSSPGSPMVASTTKFANFDGPSQSSFSFGDIAISGSGILYGSSNRGFFSLDIGGGTPSGFTNYGLSGISPFGESVLQIGLNETQTGLYAHSFNTGRWYDLTFNGVLTPILDGASPFTTTKLRDISSAPSIAAVPEPSTLVLAALGLPMALVIARRNRRRRSA